MDFDKAKRKFIDEWGTMSQNWGVCRTMGMIHGLLLISKEPICADDIKKELQLSQGNVNMNLHTLMDWGLVEKKCKTGCRKNLYTAEKDLSKVFKLIIENRKKKELDPLLNLVDDLNVVKPLCEDSKELCGMLQQLKVFSTKADLALNSLTSGKLDWLQKIALR